MFIQSISSLIDQLILTHIFLLSESLQLHLWSIMIERNKFKAIIGSTYDPCSIATEKNFIKLCIKSNIHGVVITYNCIRINNVNIRLLI